MIHNSVGKCQYEEVTHGVERCGAVWSGAERRNTVVARDRKIVGSIGGNQAELDSYMFKLKTVFSRHDSAGRTKEAGRHKESQRTFRFPAQKSVSPLSRLGALVFPFVDVTTVCVHGMRVIVKRDD